MAKKLGRSSEYTDAMAVRVCLELAKGTPWRFIDKNPSLPAARTIRAWEKNNDEFAAHMQVARQIRATALAEKGLGELTDLSDEDLKKLGKVAAPAVSLRKERAAYYKWLAGVTDRARYGDALKVDMDVKNQVLVAFVDMKPKTAEDIINQNEPYIMPHVKVPDGASRT